LLNEVNSFNNVNNLTANVSNSWQGIGDFLLHDYKRGLNATSYSFNEYTSPFFDGEVNNVFRTEYGVGNINDLSALGFQQYKEFPGERFTPVLNGFSKLTDFFANQVQGYFSQAVTNIDVTTSRIQLTLASNPNNTKEKGYFADHVISTIPLGFVKENLATLFTPSMVKMSYKKARAIKRLDFGTVNKFCIIYPGQLFTREEKGLSIFWFGDNPHLDAKYNLKVGLCLIHL
jgi:hypothetical protein